MFGRMPALLPSKLPKRPLQTDLKEDLLDPLRGMTISSPGLVVMLADDTDGELIAKVDEYWSLSITQDVVDEIRPSILLQGLPTRWLVY